MSPKTAKKYLAKAIASELGVLLVGPPGCGKSDIVHQACADAGADLVVFHPVVSDPTDFKGMPMSNAEGTEANFLPFGELKKLLNATRLTVCFIDDIGQAPPSVQAALMQLVLARQINGHKISDKVVFIGATNRREDKAAVSGLIEPLKSRFSTILHIEPSVDDLCEWMLDNDVPPVAVAFLRFRPELLTNPSAPTNDFVNRALGRTIMNMISWYKIGVVDLEVLGGAAGKGFASEFIGFLRVWEGLPNIESIRTDPARAVVPTEPAALFAVAVAVASRIAADTASWVIRYLVRLPQEFAVLGLRDALRKLPAAANSKEYIKWAVANQDLLI